MTKATYLIFRLTVGISLFGHGLVRLTKLSAFSHYMVTLFEKSILPKFLVLPFSYILPFVELTVGLLLILGLFTRAAIYTGVAVMLILIFGTTMVEDWSALPSQFIHAGFLAICLQFMSSNSWCLDKKI